MKKPLLPQDGAKFLARIQSEGDGFRAFCHAQLDLDTRCKRKCRPAGCSTQGKTPLPGLIAKDRHVVFPAFTWRIWPRMQTPNLPLECEAGRALFVCESSCPPPTPHSLNTGAAKSWVASSGGVLLCPHSSG
jgi:hypothetical protein